MLWRTNWKRRRRRCLSYRLREIILQRSKNCRRKTKGCLRSLSVRGSLVYGLMGSNASRINASRINASRINTQRTNTQRANTQRTNTQRAGAGYACSRREGNSAIGWGVLCEWSPRKEWISAIISCLFYVTLSVSLSRYLLRCSLRCTEKKMGFVS